MVIRKTTNITMVSALVATFLLVGCGGEKTESMLASAKDYMAKNDSKAAVIQLKNVLQNSPNLAEARFLLGRALLASGDATAAEVELRKALDFKYPADQVIPVLARAMLTLGQFKKIADEFAKSELALPESMADLQTSKGLAHLMLGNVDAALASFDAAILVSPGYGPAAIGLARVKAGRRDFSGALAMLESALEKSPKLHEGWQLKGDVLLSQGDVTGAVACYRKALELKPDFLQAHSSLVSRLLEEGKLEDAGKQLEKMKQFAPRHPQTSYLQGMLAYREKNYKAAREALQSHLKLVPDSAPGLQLAGAVEYELKAYAQAEAYLLKALAKAPDLGLARRVLIASYLQSGQTAKAVSTLEPILPKIDKDSNLLGLAGEVYMHSGDLAKAEAYFEKSAALDPASTGKRTSLAISRLAKGDTVSAYRELEQVAAVDSGINADLALIAAELRRRQFDQALKAIGILEKKQPGNPLAQSLRGAAQLGKGDVAAARKSFEQALQLNPAYFPAAASLANLDLTDKKPEDAIKRFEAVIAKDPKSVQAYLALAELRAKTGAKTGEIAALIEKAVAANPSEPGPRLALIGLYMGAKEIKKAVSAAQEALSVLPNQPEVLDAAGRTQQAAEDFNQALATYGKLATLTPNSTLPFLRMAEIQVAAKNKEAARQELRKALVIKPDAVEAQRGMIMLDLDAGKFPDALSTARQVQTQRPKQAVGYALEGDIHASRKSWGDAAAAYRTGVKHGGGVDLVIKQHSVLTFGGDLAEANKLADSWLRDNPKDRVFRLYLAEAASARKDFATAGKHFRILLDGQPENPALLNNIAWVGSQLKDPQAIEHAEKANKLAPDQPAIMDTLGVLLVDRGDFSRGLELLQKAVALAPKNEAIRLNLARALVKAGKKVEARRELEALAGLGEKYAAQAEVSALLKGL